MSEEGGVEGPAEGSPEALLHGTDVRFALCVAAVLTAAFIVVLTMAQWLTPFEAEYLVGEASVVERGSAVLWGASSLLLLLAGLHTRTRRTDLMTLSFVFMLLLLREIDLHKRLFSWNVSKIDNLIDGAFPLGERLGVIVFVLIPLVGAFWILGRRWLPSFPGGLKRREPWALALAAWVLILALAQIVDKSAHPLLALGVEISDEYLFRAVEESFELGLAAFSFIVVSLVQWRHRTGAGRIADPV